LISSKEQAINNYQSSLKDSEKLLKSLVEKMKSIHYSIQRLNEDVESIKLHSNEQDGKISKLKGGN